MTETALQQDLAEMSSAEDFLLYFGIDFDPNVVEVSRLHILQRFHDYLQKGEARDRAGYTQCLQRSYQDFVESDPLTEKVFQVFHRQAAARETRIPLSDIGRRP